MSSSIVRKGYLSELDIVRAFGIIGVLLIHATSSAVVSTDPYSLEFTAYASFNQLSRFAVPIFFLLSGLSLFYNYHEKPFTVKAVKIFYTKRIAKILLPFVLFSLLYYAVVVYFRYGYTDLTQFTSHFFTWDFVVKLLIGKTYAHLYFIFIIIQYYLLFPLLWFAIQRWPNRQRWLIPSGLLVQWLYMMVADDLGIKYVTSGCFAYSLYFCIGAYIGINYSKHQHNGKHRLGGASLRLMLSALWVLLGAFYVYFAIYEAQGRMVFTQPFAIEIMDEVYITTACLLLISLALFINESSLRALKKLLIHLGVTSFGIYLIHPLFLKYYRLMDIQTNSSIYGLWIAGGFFVALLGSWAIVTCAGKVRGHWILFGQISHKKK
ncbi:MAG: acyltransferase [Candidatus Cohnella colombiensis]|uniref:Acyltransferase n=1 Tax=Candidatus Cohnella colombiensis TaxID=3121368 RepID=A0AA95EWC1_9BACL|nr:MAG: acyltransferase [Cohnella sp.]